MRYTKLSYEDTLAALAESLGGDVATARRQLQRLCDIGFNVVGVERIEAPSEATQNIKFEHNTFINCTMEELRKLAERPDHHT